MAGGESAMAPLSARQATRLETAIAVAEAATGLRFGVFLGELEEPTRTSAENLHARMARPAITVLIAVSPNQRVVEIVTGQAARRGLSDRSCHLAARSMTSAFAGGDLAGGILAGIAQLADHAGADQARS